MIVQTIHEWQEPWDCYVRKLGHGLVKAMFSGSVSANPSFLVQFYHTGQLRVVDMVDLVAYGNPSAGESLTPPIPEDWKPQDNGVKPWQCWCGFVNHIRPLKPFGEMACEGCGKTHGFFVL